MPLYYHADGLGSIAAVTNASRAVAASYVYDAFGNTTMQTQIVVSPYGFTGREAASGDGAANPSGLYYYRARYYDPLFGRFLSEDPIGLAGGTNAYTYADNRPTTTFDPSGLSGEDASNSRMTDQVAAGLQRLLDLLPGDPDCLKFLCNGKRSPIDTLHDLLDFGAFGVAPIPPETDRSGNPVSITNALSNGYIAGQAITVNTLGAFFNKSYDGAPLTTDRGRIVGGTPKAQGVILLHELAHLMDVIQPDRDRQRQVDQNDKILEKNCKKLIKALGKR